MRPSWLHAKLVTGVLRSLISSTDHRPSYLIHTKMIPELSQLASFWYGSFHLTRTTCKTRGRFPPFIYKSLNLLGSGRMGLKKRRPRRVSFPSSCPKVLWLSHRRREAGEGIDEGARRQSVGRRLLSSGDTPQNYVTFSGERKSKDMDTRNR